MLTGLLVLATFSPAMAAIDWNLGYTLNIEGKPLDMAVSLNGSWIFVLTDKGNIQVFSMQGRLEGKIPVGPQIDQIKAGPSENILFLKSRTKQTVQILSLDFIRSIDIQGSPFKGPADAPVTIVVFSEFECVYCKKLVGLLDQVLEAYPKEVKLVFKNFPITRHRFSEKAAIAALAADSQGKFWPYHDRLFELNDQFREDTFINIAKELNLDRRAFEAKMKDPQLLAKVRRDSMDGRNAGVRGTPTVFVNGKELTRRSMEGLKALIDKELSR